MKVEVKLKEALFILEQDYINNRKILLSALERVCKENPVKNTLICTSEQGHNPIYHIVSTNANLEFLFILDCEYGARSRFASTTIEQLEEGAKKRGFLFTVQGTRKEVPTKEEVVKLREKGEYYIASYGNY
jgi:urease beta subunit